MTPTFKDHFSSGSEAYRTYRPDYPAALFDWLAQQAPAREAALDCGCGNGQAALALARLFSRVEAVDPSAEQIGQAVPHPRIRYRIAPAEDTGLPARSIDLALAAQALHWFDHPRFYAELRRLARPGAVFAAVSYGLLQITPELDAVLEYLYYDVVGPFWPPERRHVDDGYRTLPFPFTELTPPAFVMTLRWTLPHLIGYLGTWSAVKRYRRQHGSDPVAFVTSDLQHAWGDPQRELEIRWPLTVRAGCIA